MIYTKIFVNLTKEYLAWIYFQMRLFSSLFLLGNDIFLVQIIVDSLYKCDKWLPSIVYSIIFFLVWLFDLSYNFNHL